MTRQYSPEEMLERLIAFDTVSDRSNLDLIAFVETYLANWNVASQRVYDTSGHKASLIASIGPEADGGIVLSAHTDVVPVDGQPWSANPFKMRVTDGRLYGRGAADMKGFAATVLSHVPKFLQADLKRPLHIALSYDEEIGCLGAPALVERLLKSGGRPELVIVGEPTRMKVVTGHKGIIVLKTAVHGHAVHSSQLHRGVSAISVAARLITWLDAQTAENRENAESGSPFDPPYTTLHCGTITGGQAHNITAPFCEFQTDIRMMPGEKAEHWVARYRRFIDEEILPSIRSIAPDCRIDITEIANVAGLAPETDGAAERLARRITGDNGRHVVGFATEGGIFQEHGLSTVVCGPGSIDQAHQPDEYIELSELAKCSRFLDAICRHLAD